MGVTQSKTINIVNNNIYFPVDRGVPEFEKPTRQPAITPHPKANSSNKKQVFIDGIQELLKLVEEHSSNFYHRHSRVDVCRRIGMTIIKDIFQGNKDGKIETSVGRN